MGTAGSAPGTVCQTAVANPPQVPSPSERWLACQVWVGLPSAWTVDGRCHAPMRRPFGRTFSAVGVPEASTGSPSPRPASMPR